MLMWDSFEAKLLGLLSNIYYVYKEMLCKTVNYTTVVVRLWQITEYG